MIHFMLLGLLVGLMVCPDKAESATTSVSYLHGDGYASGDTTKNVVRLDALAVKDWGMVYGRVGATSFDDGNSNVFTRAIANGGRGLLIAGQLQNQYRVSQSSAGIGYSGFAYYSRNIGQSYRAVGFVKFIQPDTSNLQPATFSQVSLQPKVMSLWVDVEHQRYFNKNGVRRLDESANQVMTKGEF